MAKARMYSTHWQMLKVHKVMRVEVTTSNTTKIQKNLIRAVRRAIQKEKYMDEQFRATYPYSQLTSAVLPCNKTVEFTLDTGTSDIDTADHIFGIATKGDA